MNIKNKDDWEMLLELAINGDSESMNDVAMHYRDGIVFNDVEILKTNSKESFEWTKKSFEQGNPYGMNEYAHYFCYPENEFCKKNIDFAIKTYEQALKGGCMEAAHSLGIEYRNQQNFIKAFEYYSIAQNSNEFYESLTIGLCYYYGIGIKKDQLKAFEIFKNNNNEASSANEVNEINYLLGKIYLEGEIVNQDIKMAREYLELANEDGDHRSALELLLIIGRSDSVK